MDLERVNFSLQVVDHRVDPIHRVSDQLINRVGAQIITLIDEVCDEVWEVDGGRVTPFLGNYSEYQGRVQSGDRPLPFPLSAPPPPSASPFKHKSGSAPLKLDRKEERRRAAEQRDARSKLLKPLRRKVKAAEEEIERLELSLSELEAAQCAPDHYDRPEEVVRVAREVKEHQERLEEAMSTWELAELALSEAVEGFDKEG